MSKQSHSTRAEDGVTVVELLVVIIIIAIVAGIAMMQRGSANQQFQRQNIARELKFAFERARFDSVKRRADDTSVRAQVVVNSGTFELTTYRTSDGITFTADNIQTNFAPQNIVVAGHGSSSVPMTIYFDQRGETVDGSGAAVSAAFYVCNVSCASPGNDDANIVLVTPTGTVNLLAGGATVPAFNAPTVAAPIENAANIDLNTWTQMTPTPAP
jgi:prepilin-type N-terminal cleavage/methylation domain-containing protein